MIALHGVFDTQLFTTQTNR